jgi:hypothetical protein
MSKLQAVEVIWRDAHGGCEGWQEFDSEEHSPRHIHTVGFLLKNDDVGITVCSSVDTDADMVDGSTFIPRGMVDDVRPLTPKA